jgi:hypothetical protein
VFIKTAITSNSSAITHVKVNDQACLEEPNCHPADGLRIGLEHRTDHSIALTNF